jgi:hypothetical protein
MSDWRPMSLAPTDRRIRIMDFGGLIHEAHYQGPSDGAIYSGTPSVYNWFSISEDRSLHDQDLKGWQPL